MRQSTRVRLSRLVVCLALVAVGAVLLVPGTAVAKGKPGGKEEATPPSVEFDDADGDSVKSDLGILYEDNRKLKTGVTFTNDGHVQLNTRTSNKLGEGRSLYIDFGQLITVVDSQDVEWTFQTTDQLEEAGFQHDANLWVAAGQDNFDLFLMTEGEIRTDVNLTINLFLHFPDAPRAEVPVFIGFASYPVANGSDSVSVRCAGLDANGVPNQWEVTTQAIDHDGDGSFDEDPVDGIDNDDDGLVDEDPSGNRATVVQIGRTIGTYFFKFGMTVNSGVK